MAMRPLAGSFVIGDVSGIGDLTKESIMSTSRLQLALNVTDIDAATEGYVNQTGLLQDPRGQPVALSRQVFAVFG